MDSSSLTRYGRRAAWLRRRSFRNIVVRANPDGSVLHLAMLRVSSWVTQTYTLNGRYNNAPAGVFGVYQLPGSNAVQTAAPSTSGCSSFPANFPSGIAYEMPLDTTKAVTAGLKEIMFTLFEALGLVILVVFVFLQGWRATLIPLMAVPVSLIGTFIIFPLLGFSINTLSLFGLVLAIGLVVDDAIIVVEAVEHHIEEGMQPRDAAFKAMEEVSAAGGGHRADPGRRLHPHGRDSGNHGALVSTVRDYHRDLGHDLSVQRAFFQSRALLRLLLKPKASAEERRLLSGFYRWFNRFFGRTTNGFVSTSSVLLHKAGFSMLALVAVGILAVFIGGGFRPDFFPTEDQGYPFVAYATARRRIDAAYRQGGFAGI